MLTVIKSDSKILACCEWCRCDADGKRNSDGKYIWIAELEVAKNWQNEFIIQEIIKEIDKKAGDATHVYFWRSKYNKRIRVYTREQFLNFVRGRECSLSLA